MNEWVVQDVFFEKNFNFSIFLNFYNFFSEFGRFFSQLLTHSHLFVEKKFVSGEYLMQYRCSFHRHSHSQVFRRAPEENPHGIGNLVRQFWRQKFRLITKMRHTVIVNFHGEFPVHSAAFRREKPMGFNRTTMQKRHALNNEQLIHVKNEWNSDD